MELNTILYIFEKDGRFMVLNHKDAMEFQKDDDFNVWNHASTIDPEAWLTSMLNSKDPSVQIDEVKGSNA